MKYEDIANHILNSCNKYESELGIKTVKVEEQIKKENWAILYGYKSDNTITLFFARKNKRAADDKWGWFCPSDPEIEGFRLIINMYEIRNQKNNMERKKS